MDLNDVISEVKRNLIEGNIEEALDAPDFLVRDLFGDESNRSESDFARAVYMLGKIFLTQEKYPPALSEFWIAARIQYRIGDLGAIVETFQGIFEAYLGAGELAKTCAYIRDLEVLDGKLKLAISRARKLSDPKREGDLRHIQARAAKKRGDVNKAISLHTLNFTIRHQAGDRSGLGYTLFELAKCYSAIGKTESYQNDLQAALEIFQEQSNEEMIKTINSLLL